MVGLNDLWWFFQPKQFYEHFFLKRIHEKADKSSQLLRDCPSVFLNCRILPWIQEWRGKTWSEVNYRTRIEKKITEIYCDGKLKWYTKAKIPSKHGKGWCESTSVFSTGTNLFHSSPSDLPSMTLWWPAITGAIAVVTFMLTHNNSSFQWIFAATLGHSSEKCRCSLSALEFIRQNLISGHDLILAWQGFKSQQAENACPSSPHLQLDN